MPREPTAPSDRSTVAARWCAALLMAMFVSGRAARDALYLAHLPVTTLPVIVLASAVTAILFALAWPRLLSRLAPARLLVDALLAGSALFVLEWLLCARAPRAAAVAVYVQVSVLAPLLGSSLWLLASERFDPHSARRAVAGMVSAGTAGGLVGGLLTERVAATWGPPSVLILLAVASIAAAYHVNRLGAGASASAVRELPAALSPARWLA